MKYKIKRLIPNTTGFSAIGVYSKPNERAKDFEIQLPNGLTASEFKNHLESILEKL